MKTLKINRNNLGDFSYFAEKHKLEFKECVDSVFSDSIYFGSSNGSYVSWDNNEEKETLKIAVKLINIFLVNYKLEFEEDK